MKHRMVCAALALSCLPFFGCSQAVTAGKNPSLVGQSQETAAVPPSNNSALATTRQNDTADDNRDFYGQDYGVRASYQDCMTHQADGASTAGHRQDCADTEYDFQDERLNRIYRQALDNLENRQGQPTEESTRLRAAQRLWLSQLDRTCAHEADRAGSAMGPAAQSTCLMDMTAKRADELERRYRNASL